MNAKKYLYSHKNQSIPENLALKTNIEEFYQKISHISNLEMNGQITPQEAYKQIKLFWKKLKTSKKQLKLSQKKLKGKNS